MANAYFQFKQFTIQQGDCAMKVTTDACLFGAWAAQQIQACPTVKDLVDIGAGTGLLSLMIAQHSPAIIDAIELQEKDFRQCLQNINASPWPNQIHAIHADALQYRYQKDYDVIISNPPFYENDLKSNDDHKNRAHHEAGLKLENLIEIINQHLSPHGRFYLLLPQKREKVLLGALANSNLYINKKTFVHQSEHHKAFRFMLEGSRKPAHIMTSSISIKNNNQYTIDFNHLLKDYYLNL